MNYAQTVGTKVSLTSSGLPKPAVSVSITTTGNPVLVGAYGDANNSSAVIFGQLQLYRGATALGNSTYVEASGNNENQEFSLSVIDAPAAGTYTYSLQLINANNTIDFGESAGPVIWAVELTGKVGPTGATGPTGTLPVTTGFISPTSSLTVDNLKFTITSSGNRGLSLATVSGTESFYVSANYSVVTGGHSGSATGSAITYTTTPSSSLFNYNFQSVGDTSQYLLTDTTTPRIYRVTIIIGPSYNNTFITVEKIVG
jgi:hypothetical protein